MTKQINVEDRPGRRPRGWLPVQKANFSGEMVALTALMAAAPCGCVIW